MGSTVKASGFMGRMLNQVFPNYVFGRSVYKTQGFRKYGLMTDDMIRTDLPEVQEAIRRLSPDIAHERQFRIARALQLSISKTYLPEKEWMTEEEDVSYLAGLIKQVQGEMDEKLAYETRFYSYKSGQKF